MFEETIDRFKLLVNQHPGCQALTTFSEQFCAQPLDERQLKLFFSTLWAFYRETAIGILALSLRVCDDWLLHSPWEATAVAANLVYADIDEFDLAGDEVRERLTHHQLFQLTAHHFQVSDEDLIDSRYCLSGGTKIGTASVEYYRSHSIAAGLGFHFASELTSHLEFIEFFKGFSKFPEEYRLTDQDHKALLFFKIHTQVEPAHLEKASDIIELYLRRDPAFAQEMEQGLTVYMDNYLELFADLNQRLF